MRKRLIGVAALLIGIVCCAFATAYADDIQYEKLTDTTVCITHAEMQGDIVNIPSEIDGYTVTGIRFDNPNAEARYIKLPHTVEQIAPGEFKDWLSLENIYMDPRNACFFQSDGVLYSRGDRSLHTYPCAKADRAYTIKDGTMSIGAHAFQNCFYLEEVEMPSSVTSIGVEAFAENSVLTKCELPEGLIEIGDRAFRACRVWNGSKIPASVETIGINPFDGCLEIARLNVASGSACFAQIDGVLFDKRSKKLISYPAAKMDEAYTIPSGICAVEPEAFRKNQYIQSVVFPQSVESIGAYAMQGCLQLKKVSWLDGLQRIEKYAFAETSLLEIAIPTTITEIADYTFYKCAYLQKADLPEGLEKIGEKAFARTRIQELKCPSTLKNIEKEAFSECRSLEKVEICGENCIVSERAFKKDVMLNQLLISGRTTLGDYAFEGCSALKDVSITGMTEQVGEGCFSACLLLEDVCFTEGLTQIGERAFEKCTALHEITLPYSLEYIGDEAFTLTDRFTLIVQPASFAEEYANDRNIPCQQINNWL